MVCVPEGIGGEAIEKNYKGIVTSTGSMLNKTWLSSAEEWTVLTNLLPLFKCDFLMVTNRKG